MVAVPTLAGAVIRLLNGLLVDRIGPKLTGTISQVIVIAGLFAAWWFGVSTYEGTLLVGLVLGFAGASFAVSLPLASRWYPPEHQGKAMGIAGMGNSGTVLAALFAPGLAKAYGWNNVLGLACIPLAVVFVIYLIAAKDSPDQPAPKPISAYGEVLKDKDAWWFRLFYGVFTGSLIRPFGGAMADRFGGIRTLTFVYILAAIILVVISTGPATLPLALTLFILVTGTLGAGNGAVFQLVPQRFRKEIGVMTGLVGFGGGIGGFYLASSLGYAKKLTGSSSPGFLIFAGLAVIALLGLTAVKSRWRTTWGAALQGARI